MKMDSKILNSVVFLDVPIILKWSELIYWLLLQIMNIVKQRTYSEIIC